MNAFGENLHIEEAESALAMACRRGHAEVVDFIVVPRYPSMGEPRGRHEWLVEFAEPARAPAVFVRVLDETLQALNIDYRSRRVREVGMGPPRVLEVPPGTFYRWRCEREKLGEHLDVPRLTNDRRAADRLFSIITTRRQQPLLL